MRYLVLVLLAMALMVSVAYADQTSGATYTSPNGCVDQEFVDFINEQTYIDHTHQVDRDDPLGVGVDVVVYENKEKDPTVSVEVQGKLDMQNDETSVFLVGKVNLFKMFQKAKPVEVTEPVTE